MIRLSNILSELLVTESLPISVARKYMAIQRSKVSQKRMEEVFQKIVALPGASTSKRKDRVYFEFSHKDDSPINSLTKTEIETLLASSGQYTLKDYAEGIATDKYGRDVKLGKVLTKLKRKDLLDLFNKDEERNRGKRKTYIMVFSKHPYDIAGMSTDRGWSSCMNLYTGGYRKYVSADIKNGTFVCYLTKPEDKNLSSPTARVSIKPFINIKNPRDVVYGAEDRVYGTAPAQFLQKVYSILSDAQGEKVGLFKIHSRLYCDTKPDVVFYEKRFEDMISGKAKPETKEDVVEILEKMQINRGYTINEDLTVDVNGNVLLRIKGRKLSVIPVKFGKVLGGFDASYNALTSLENAPHTVLGSLNLHNNRLTSLKGCPQKIGGNLVVTTNKLVSLEGAPPHIEGGFSCSGNELTSLKGAPKKIEGTFIATYNSLTSLENGPTEVGGNYMVESNSLTTLKGAPKKINGAFYVDYNPSLESLKDGPVEVKTTYSFFRTKIDKSEKEWICNNIKAGDLNGHFYDSERKSSIWTKCE